MTQPPVTDHAFVKTAWTRNCAHLADPSTERCNRPLSDHYGVPPPWWKWFEPPTWFPKWLHALTCTYCRTLRRYRRKARKGRIEVLP